MTLAEILKIQSDLEAKATPGPWEAFDNYIQAESVRDKGERGILLAEFFGSNPIYGDNENDTHFVEHLRNHAAQIRADVLKMVEELKNHCEETTGYYSCRCTGDSYDVRELLNELGFGGQE